MMVSEVGSTEYGGSKATWIKEMLNTVPTDYPKIRGLLWFEKYDDGMDWPIETSSRATSAFADGNPEPGLRRATSSARWPSARSARRLARRLLVKATGQTSN